MKTRNATTQPVPAATEAAARRLWPRIKEQNGLDPMRTHAVAATVAAAVGRTRLLTDILQSALDQELDRIAIEEALLQVYLFAGYPRAIEALLAMAATWPRQMRAESIPQTQWNDAGERLCRTVYGHNFGKLNDNIAAAHPDLKTWMITEGYGKVLSRPGLDSVSRELCTVGALTAMDAPRQLQAHLLGARNVGASRPQIERAVALGAVGCGVRVWQKSQSLFLDLMGPR